MIFSFAVMRMSVHTFLPLSISTTMGLHGMISLLHTAGFGFHGPRRVLFWIKWTRPHTFNRLIFQRPWARTLWSRTSYLMGSGRWRARFCLSLPARDLILLGHSAS